jgi:hypothetical protein
MSAAAQGRLTQVTSTASGMVGRCRDKQIACTLGVRDQFPVMSEDYSPLTVVAKPTYDCADTSRPPMTTSPRPVGSYRRLRPVVAQLINLGLDHPRGSANR